MKGLRIVNFKQFNPAKSLYTQIEESIKKEISSGRLKAGDKVPSERELCEMFGVSRITARQAINEMVKKDLLFTVQGKGTFVANANNEKLTISQGLMNITTFENTIANIGQSAGTRIENYKIMPVDFELCKILNLNITDQILNLNLIGTADGLPVVLYQSFFAMDLGFRIYEEAQKKEKENIPFSTIDLYKSFSNIAPSYVEQTFEAIIANTKLSETLKIEKGEPLFLVSSIIYAKGDAPIEYKKAYYRGNKYKFHIKRYI